jgi:hypothetical protein
MHRDSKRHHKNAKHKEANGESMSLKIEPRAYGPDSTQAEIEALRNRVRFHEGLTVVFEEVTVGSEFQVDVCFGRVEELLREHDCDSLIIDLREAKRPNAAMREKLRNRIREIGPILRQVAVFTGKNFLVNVAARFVLAGIPQPFTVNKTLAEAEEAIRNGN